jgi:hypothetical protein
MTLNYRVSTEIARITGYGGPINWNRCLRRDKTSAADSHVAIRPVLSSSLLKIASFLWNLQYLFLHQRHRLNRLQEMTAYVYRLSTIQLAGRRYSLPEPKAYSPAGRIRSSLQSYSSKATMWSPSCHYYPAEVILVGWLGYVQLPLTQVLNPLQRIIYPHHMLYYKYDLECHFMD